MKITKKRGKRGVERKAFTARLPIEHYMKLCQFAGSKSLAVALRELIEQHERKKHELVIPTSHD